LSVALRGGTANGYRTREISPALEMDLGQTIAWGGAIRTETKFTVDRRSKRRSATTTTSQTLLLATPERVEPALDRGHNGLAERPKAPTAPWKPR
jgi:hypothetical protein